MKSKNVFFKFVAAVVLAASVTLVVACSLAPSSLSHGSLRFATAHSRELGVTGLYSWKISGEGPNSASFAQSSDASTDIVIPNVVTGAWIITVEGSDLAGEVLYAKTETIVIVPGENAISITLELVSALAARWDFEDGSLVDSVGGVSIIPSLVDDVVVNPAGAYNSSNGLSWLKPAAYGEFGATGLKDKTGPWTVSFWMKHVETQDGAVLASANGSIVISLFAQGTLGISDGITTTYFGGPSFKNYTWNHVVVSSTGSSITLYLDGVASDPIDSNLPLPLDYLEGTFNTGTATFQNNLMVPLDDLRVYTKAFSQADVDTLYQSYPVALNISQYLAGETDFELIGGGFVVNTAPNFGSGGYYEYDTKVTLIATANGPSYVFINWTDDVTGDILGSGSTLEVTMNKNQKIRANFDTPIQ